MQAQADLPWTVVGTSWGGTTDWRAGIASPSGTNKALCDAQ